MICQTVVALLALCSLVSPYPSVLLRCSQCSEAEEDSGSNSTEVCGSDWKTYSSPCQLEWEACKRNWRIVEVSEGQCVSHCPGVDLGMFGVAQHFHYWRINPTLSLGMFSATGTFRASNKGSCIQDYFRCRKLSKQQGLEGQAAKECCLER